MLSALQKIREATCTWVPSSLELAEAFKLRKPRNRHPATQNALRSNRDHAIVHRAQTRAHDVHDAQGEHWRLLDEIQKPLFIHGNDDGFPGGFCRCTSSFLADQGHFAENSAGRN